MFHGSVNYKFCFHKKCLDFAKCHFTYSWISDEPKVKSDSSQNNAKMITSSSVSEMDDAVFGRMLVSRLKGY